MASENAKRRAQAIVAVGRLPRFQRNNHRITMLSAPTPRDGGCVRINVQVTDPDGDEVPVNNPIIICNPPIDVRQSDGTVVENPAQALRDVLARILGVI